MSDKKDHIPRSSQTTRTLHIVRHGKALQSYSSINDFDRPLTEKGIANTVAMAGQLRNKCDTPALIVTSYAARAMHTAHIFARLMEYPNEKVQVNNRLYSDGEKEAHSILENLPDDLNSVMIVGHNPDVTYLANAYAGRDIELIPTSGVVTICFETDQWSDIANAKRKCVVHFPKSMDA